MLTSIIYYNNTNNKSNNYIRTKHYTDLQNLIISMTKLLNADWLRGVQLFH
jgi:hypothetical protein